MIYACFRRLPPAGCERAAKSGMDGRIFKEVGLDIVNEMNIKLIVIDMTNEVIDLWIN